MLRQATVLLSLSLLCSACETSDPCILRQAACLDVKLIGNPDPYYYQNVTVRVTDRAGKELVPPVQMAELRATARANTETTVSFQLPDSYNALDDIKPKEAIRGLANDDERIARLEELRDKDPRALRIVVTGTEAGGGPPGMVRWDSKEEEDWRIAAAKMEGNVDPWLHFMYFRVGRNEYVGPDKGVIAYLLRVMMK
jgi:hypothetical protein